MNVLIFISLIVFCLLTMLLLIRYRSDIKQRKISSELILKRSFQPPSGKKTERMVFQIYLLLAVWVIRKNSIKSIEKQSFIVVYINKKFNIESLVIVNELELVEETSIHVRSVANWVVQKMPGSQERAELIDFLIDLVFVDGELIDREFTALVRLGELIGVQSMYIEKRVIESRKRIFGQSSGESRLHEIANSGTRKRMALAILDLNTNATEDDIKKSYRRLVKKYHPDRNLDLSEQERGEFAQRFLEIQDAYEELSSN
ncbi:heat shock protein DnaJ domain protein [Fluviicola taffensis DSM 16823]|uniref:Heat shock protein DnaJ domain protein n=2 Tax=Fluviicola TaxID=332102 RepID=F2IBS5_FLUTR|nr:heat shock protein DnaJ domain protein [Fluviicola taffensis DSM 16823]